jgi:predicted ATPase
MEQMAALVLQEAQTILDKIKIYKIQIARTDSPEQVVRSDRSGKRCTLAIRGLNSPLHLTKPKLVKRYKTRCGPTQSGRRIEELIDLPVMSDRSNSGSHGPMLGHVICTHVFQGMPGLMPILSATMVSLSLSFGNTPASTVGLCDSRTMVL